MKRLTVNIYLGHPILNLGPISFFHSQVRIESLRAQESRGLYSTFLQGATENELTTPATRAEKVLIVVSM